jgi:hypothetical protein
MPDCSEWFASCLNHFIPRERSPRSHWTGGLGLDNFTNLWLQWSVWPKVKRNLQIYVRFPSTTATITKKLGFWTQTVWQEIFLALYRLNENTSSIKFLSFIKQIIGLCPILLHLHLYTNVWYFQFLPSHWISHHNCFQSNQFLSQGMVISNAFIPH